MKSGSLKNFAGALTVIAAFAADQISKSIIRAHPVQHWPWPGFFEFTSHQNFGLIANAPVPMYLIVPITLAITTYLGYKIFLDGNNASTGERLSLAIILGGAIGNLTDRIRIGYVFDWIMLFNTSIINIADIAIAAGILWYAILLWRKKD